jgi:hypothetical protein
MKTKLLGILICMLLISIAILPAAGAMNDNIISDVTSYDYIYSTVQQKFEVGFIKEDWQEQVKLLASDGETDDRFGLSVAIDGDYAIVTAANDDGYKGAAYIFKHTSTTWTEEIKLTASDGAPMDAFGFRATIGGDYALVGAGQNDNVNGFDAGAVYVFKRTGTTWTEEQKLLASDGASYDYFGFHVSIDGDRAIIGADRDDDNGNGCGAAYIFKRTGTTWTEEAKLTASDGADWDIFGCCDINGDYAIVGANRDDNSNGVDAGSAYIFKYNGTNWNEEVKLIASDGADDDYFGFPVLIDEDYAIIGAGANDNSNGVDAGAVYIFKHTDTGWIEDAKLTASDGEAGSWFGSSASISDEYLIVAAPYSGDNGGWSGSAYIFKRYGTAWIEETKLTASDGKAWQMFGISVSISGAYALLGAWGDDNMTGSAYVFNRTYTPIYVDIKPSEYPNLINPRSKGRVPVAVLTTDYFDAGNVKPDTVIFLNATPVMHIMEDVDNDGDDDMLFFFKIQDLDFDLLEYIEGQEFPFATLNGETYDGISIKGKDTVRLIGLLGFLLETILEKLHQKFERLKQIFE